MYKRELENPTWSWKVTLIFKFGKVFSGFLLVGEIFIKQVTFDLEVE